MYRPPALLQEAAAQLNDWVNLLTTWCNDQNLADGVPEAGDNVAFTFTRAERRAFVGIATDLRIAFDCLEKTHRKAHQLTGTNRAREQPEARYKKLVASRRAIALQQYPRPIERTPPQATHAGTLWATTQSAQELSMWQRHHRYLGLLPEDQGYIPWQIAMQGAVATLQTLLNANTNPNITPANVAAYTTSFPHPGAEV